MIKTIIINWNQLTLMGLCDRRFHSTLVFTDYIEGIRQLGQPKRLSSRLMLLNSRIVCPTAYFFSILATSTLL